MAVILIAEDEKWQKDAVIPADRTEIGVNTEIDMRIEKRMMDDLDSMLKNKSAGITFLDLHLLHRSGRRYSGPVHTLCMAYYSDDCQLLPETY